MRVGSACVKKGGGQRRIGEKLKGQTKRLKGRPDKASKTKQKNKGRGNFTEGEEIEDDVSKFTSPGIGLEFNITSASHPVVKHLKHMPLPV